MSAPISRNPSSVSLNDIANKGAFVPKLLEGPLKSYCRNCNQLENTHVWENGAAGSHSGGQRRRCSTAQELSSRTPSKNTTPQQVWTPEEHSTVPEDHGGENSFRRPTVRVAPFGTEENIEQIHHTGGKKRAQDVLPEAGHRVTTRQSIDVGTVDYSIGGTRTGRKMPPVLTECGMSGSLLRGDARQRTPNLPRRESIRDNRGHTPFSA